MNSALREILTRAGQLMLSFEHPRVEDKGGHANYVTEADVAVQTFLEEELGRAFPGVGFLAEEQENGALTDAPTFIIDPIDGTTNYFRRRKASVISVGMVSGKRPVLGAIYDPYRDELFHAEQGKGAYMNDDRLHVSDVPFERALVELGTGPYYEDLMALTGRTVAELLPKIADFRRSGSAATDLTKVAAGLSDGMFEWMLQPWDYCAGSLLVEEAGDRYGAITGGAPSFEQGTPYMAANARCFDRLQEELMRIREL